MSERRQWLIVIIASLGIFMAGLGLGRSWGASEDYKLGYDIGRKAQSKIERQNCDQNR